MIKSHDVVQGGPNERHNVAQIREFKAAEKPAGDFPEVEPDGHEKRIHPIALLTEQMAPGVASVIFCMPDERFNRRTSSHPASEARRCSFLISSHDMNVNIRDTMAAVSKIYEGAFNFR